MCAKALRFKAECDRVKGSGCDGAGGLADGASLWAVGGRLPWVPGQSPTQGYVLYSDEQKK